MKTILIIIAICALAFAQTTPKPLSAQDKADVYELLAEINECDATMAAVRDQYAQQLNEAMAELRKRKQTASEALKKKVDALGVAGYQLDRKLQWQPLPEAAKAKTATAPAK